MLAGYFYAKEWTKRAYDSLKSFDQNREGYHQFRGFDEPIEGFPQTETCFTRGDLCPVADFDHELTRRHSWPTLEIPIYWSADGQS